MTSILDCPTPVHLGSSDSLASPPGNPVSPAALREQYQRPERGVGPSTLPLMGTVPEPPIPSSDEPADTAAASEPAPPGEAAHRFTWQWL